MAGILKKYFGSVLTNEDMENIPEPIIYLSPNLSE